MNCRGTDAGNDRLAGRPRVPPPDRPAAGDDRRGETVEATSEIVGCLPKGWSVRGRIAQLSLDDFKAGEPINGVDAGVRMRGNTATLNVSDHADAFLMPVRFELVDGGGNVRDYAESALVPWRPEKLQAGPKLTVNGCYFDYRQGGLNAKACFLIGANWQDRLQYGFTWHNPNGLRVASDALKMASDGMRIVRPHYVMPGWMRITPEQVYGKALPGVYDRFELGPEISERHLRHRSPCDDLQLVGHRFQPNRLHPPAAPNGPHRELVG